MRQYLLLVWLTAVLGVFANNQAAPFELLWYYTAYKIEWRSGINPRNLATGCHHKPSAAFDAAASAAGVSGICTFDEFIQHLDPKEMFQKFKTGELLDPSDQVVRQKWTAFLIENDNPRWQGNLKDLIPETNPAVAGKGPKPFAPVIGEILGYVQDARDHAGDDHLIENWLQKSIAYIKAAAQVRMVDQASHLKDWFQDVTGDPAHWTRDPAYIITQPILYEDGTPTGQSSEKYNFELVNSNANTADLKVADYETAMQAIRSRDSYKGNKPPKGGPNHLVAIDMFLSSSNLLQLPAPSVCGVFTR